MGPAARATGARSASSLYHLVLKDLGGKWAAQVHTSMKALAVVPCIRAQPRVLAGAPEAMLVAKNLQKSVLGL